MDRAPLHIVTGGTGFVGSAIILELLATTDAQIVGLTRPAEIGAERRLRETLAAAARLYGHGARFDALIEARVEGVEADMLSPGCGVQARPEWAGAELWHCAASLQFLDRHEQQIFQTNVEGTKQVVALAAAAGVETFNMISTAYVAGTRSGVVLEAPAERMQGGTNNHYERSKIGAEEVVASSELPRVRIMRPGIVIGHSKTRAALNFNGLYGFLRNAHKFRQLMERTQRELGDSLDVRMIADADASLSFIPVDHVARDAVALSVAGADAGYFHLTAARPIPTRAALELMFEVVGLRPPSFVEDRSAFTWLDEKFNARVDFYNAYFVGPKDFSRAHTDAAAPGSPSLDFELDLAELAEFCTWYTRGVLAKRKPLPVTR